MKPRAAEGEQPLSLLPGVGPRRLAQLNKLGLFSVEDLLRRFPRDYEDRRTIRPISGLEEGAAVCVRAMVTDEPVRTRIPGGRTMARCRAFDSTGMLQLTFFNQPYLRLERGREYIFFGKPQPYGRGMGMVNPAVEPAEGARAAGRLLPVYPKTGDISQSQLRKWVRAALDLARGHYLEPLPAGVAEQWKLCPPEEAFEAIHFPKSPEDAAKARRRLIFEELFVFCCAGQRLRGKGRENPGPPLTCHDPEDFFSALPFAPTGAQRRAVEQAFSDLCGGSRMNRLLQGDVGSGKTLVAAACVWLAARNGRQAMVMAPTELLARQHRATMEQFLAPHGIPAELLISAMPAAEKRRVLARAASGEPLVLCGTHALIQNRVELPAAALVVVDEQHRFGVAQRASLNQKAHPGHLLAMSATPIPRTLTLILYGDLDVSVLDELPPGRRPVLTYAVTEEKRQGMYGFLQKEIDAGGQAYIVCPLVEEGEEGSEKKAAAAYIGQLQKALPRLRIGLMHGRLRPAEKEAVMASFAAGELDVLVSTTVIEVGVDVPRATVMIVENADFFGLSQLHQLRGRVGRGSRQSWCFLMHHARTEAARERLQTLCRTCDGFQIAEADLRLRGPGDFFGQRQSGLPAFAIADLATDINVLEAARQSALDTLARDPTLGDNPLLAARVEEVIQKTLAASMN